MFKNLSFTYPQRKRESVWTSSHPLIHGFTIYRIEILENNGKGEFSGYTVKVKQSKFLNSNTDFFFSCKMTKALQNYIKKFELYIWYKN